MKYCEICERNVSPKKGFSWVGFIFGFGIFYLIYYLLKAKRCPICNGRKFDSPINVRASRRAKRKR